MWIKSLKILNFKQYKYQIFNFTPPPILNLSNNKSLFDSDLDHHSAQNTFSSDISENLSRVILIGGQNGYGKTTFLESLYLVLHGSSVIQYLKSAGYTEQSLFSKYAEQEALSRLAKFDANQYENLNIEITLEIVDNLVELSGWKIKRVWQFSSEGIYQKELSYFYKIQQNQEDIEVLFGDSQLAESIDIEDIQQNQRLIQSQQQQLINRFIPENLLNFFLFDGEKIRQFTEQSSKDAIKQSIQQLLGIQVLDSVDISLQGYRKHTLKNVKKSEMKQQSNDVDKLLKLEQQSERYLMDIQLASACLIDFEHQKKEVLIQIDALQRELIDLAGDSTNAKRYEEALSKLNSANKEYQLIDKQIHDMVSETLPFCLISKHIFVDYKNQLKQEAISIEFDQDKQKSEYRKNDLIALVQSDLNPPLNDEQKNQLIYKINDVWNNYFKSPENYTDQLIHSYLESSNQRQRLVDYLSDLDIQQLNTLYDKKFELNQEIEINDAIISDYKSHKESIRKVLDEGRNQLILLSQKLNEINNNIIKNQSNKTYFESQLHQIKTEIGDLNKRIELSKPDQDRYQKYLQLLELNRKIREELYPSKLAELSKETTKIYKQFAHKDQIDRIEIDSTGEIKYYSHNNQILDFNKSAGENQLVALSMIIALAKISNCKAPLVVDTPLGRLDIEHKQQLIKFWTEQTDRQVILLCTNSEISPAIYEKNKHRFSKTYLLKQRNSALNKSIKETFAEENQYFS